MPRCTCCRAKRLLETLDAGGIDVFEADLDAFRKALTVENRTLKRALTDPRNLSGIGNAYSDEILHAARLSPIALTGKLSEAEWQRLFDATRATLRLWIERLRAEAGDAFPERVTAFRKDMSVHGRFGQACPDCGEPVQRIRYADNETNYCAKCQTERQTARGSQPLASVESRLAAHARGTGEPETAPAFGERPHLKRRSYLPLNAGAGKGSSKSDKRSSLASAPEPGTATPS